MGLDQYLIAVPKGEDPVESEGKVELIYWRKANQIHKWMLDAITPMDVDEDSLNLIPMPVPSEALAALHQACKDVLADPSLGPDILPTHAGFFYGSYDYDDWYLRDLNHTVEKLESEVLNNPQIHGMDIYYYGWW
jgi:hypothetical protein